MRCWLLLLLVACGSDEECMPVVGSRITNRIGFVASGRDLAGISWTETRTDDNPLIHAALVMNDNSMSSDVSISSSQVYGVAGKTTVLWGHEHDGDDCEGSKVFDVLLQSATDTKGVSVAGVTSARTSVFDGTRYQLFWTENTKAFHRTLDEDGTLGPEHDLGITDTFCVVAASDGAGTTFALLERQGYIVDGATGAKQLVWMNPDFGNTHDPLLYFAGEFHVAGFPWWSIDPITKVARKRTPPLGGFNYYPTATKLFARTGTDIIEMDAQLALVARIPFPPSPGLMEMGTIDDDRLFIMHDLVDGFPGPTQIDLERIGAAPFKTAVAVDSPYETLHACP